MIEHCCRYGLGLFVICLMCAVPCSAFAGTNAPAYSRLLTRREFVALSAKQDTEFEAILIRELALRYAPVLRLPPNEWIASVKESYEWYPDDARSELATVLGLGRLFRDSATALDASLSVRPAFSDRDSQADFSLQFTQPIARNAFGRSTKWLSDIVGLEVDVARHQLVESYEDYLALVMSTWVEWRRAFLNADIAQSAYDENLKLLDNIRERQQQQIAKPIDVNKIALQVKAKEEEWITTKEALSNTRLRVLRMARLSESDEWMPGGTADPAPLVAFADAWGAFRTDSRTWSILQQLEDKSVLEVDRSADALLPSIALTLGLGHQGADYAFDDGETRLVAGIEAEWPFPRERDQAQLEVSRIAQQETRLANDNARYRLYTDLRNLHTELRRDGRLIALAEQKIALAEAILTDEKVNYSYGRVTLNDFIQAVNRRDAARFDHVRIRSRYDLLRIEWLRLTDRLLSEAELTP